MEARTGSPDTRPRIVIVGGGAAGTLVAVHLARSAGRRSTACDLVLVDPTDLLGRGTAFGTTDPGHLLNVPASGMSALPEDPGHFVAWRGSQDPDRPSLPWDFAPRRQFSWYLQETLSGALAGASGFATLRHVRARAVATRPAGNGVKVVTDTGRELAADAVVVATGLPEAGRAWAPETLRDSAFFVADPWAPGALDVMRRDRSGPPAVLLVGTGLTMVDVALSLTGPVERPDRVLHAVSRSARLPRVHARTAKLPIIPDVADWPSDLAGLRTRVARHLGDVTRAGGDWRPAMDGLRFQVPALWSRLSEADRREFLAQNAGAWGVLRHRMPRSSATTLQGLRGADRLRLRRATVSSAAPLQQGGLRIGLSDGGSEDVGWVVNCTGPQTDVRRLGDPLLDDLLDHLATPATAGMGFRTDQGRLAQAPVWTIGALRRGELWESTAVPEIRTQALAVATAVLDAVAPLPRRLSDGRVVSGRHPIARPRDPLGLPLSTTAEAASSFNAGLERVMRLQNGGEDLLREATQFDPGFALAHAALAMLGHEAGAAADVRASLEAARDAVRKCGDDRERSLVDVIGRRVTDARRAGARALKAHIAAYPRDVLAVSAAVPTIAFSGVTDLQQEAWELVESLAPAYGDHWWYISLLAFTRQDQSRFEEAGLLAESALACEPSSGHAAHAQTHVMYETGQHEEGTVWLDHWITETGRSGGFRAHFAWHAALHELALTDLGAVRRRFDRHLAPVTGVRALVDSASLIWRWRLEAEELAAERPPSVAPVLAAVDPALLADPQTPFIALHAVVALAAAADLDALERLRQRCLASPDPALRGEVAVVCEAMIAVVRTHWDTAWPLLEKVLPELVHIAGSAAQREIFEETLLFTLLKDGQDERAHTLLDTRLAPPSVPPRRTPAATLSTADGEPENAAAAEIEAEAMEAAGTDVDAREPADRPAGARIVIGALGVVFGDIGTSPLYALQNVFRIDDGAVRPTQGDVYGVMSLVFWSVTIVVSIKYVTVVMRADNNGEGGVMALVALVRRLMGERRSGTRAVVLLGVLGASLFYGDTLITPAISVLSAVEGLEIAEPGLAHLVLPLAAAILTGLFFAQRWGTGKVGALFGPVMVVWFAVLAVAGVRGILRTPHVLTALSPTYAVLFIVDHPSITFVAVGAVVLVITGAEALYADMGHFGRPPIRRAWFFLVFPALTLNYLGQSGLILADPTAIRDPFLLLIPSWGQLPVVVLATAATVIASQAVISGAFSVTRQAMQLGFLPPLTVRQTSEHEGGQVYLPAVNALLFVGVLLLALSFRSSERLATAYGVAVTGALLIDTVLLLVVARVGWKWSTPKLVGAGLLFGGVELAFFSGNVVKILHGGWLPLLIAASVFTVMTTWQAGRRIVVTERVELEGPLQDFVDQIRDSGVVRVPGTAVFPHPTKDTTPLALRANLQHNHVLHEKVVIISARTAAEPVVPAEKRLQVDDLGYTDDGIFHVTFHHGFSESPDIPAALRQAAQEGRLESGIDLDTASYFVSRASLQQTRNPGMVRWRKKLFVALAHNATNPADYFGLPMDRTVVMGTHLEL